MLLCLLIPQFEHEVFANACEFWNQEQEAGTGTTMIRAKSDVQIDTPEVALPSGGWRRQRDRPSHP